MEPKRGRERKGGGDQRVQASTGFRNVDGIPAVSVLFFAGKPLRFF
jgi:hypothetical protein